MQNNKKYCPLSYSSYQWSESLRGLVGVRLTECWTKSCNINSNKLWTTSSQGKSGQREHIHRLPGRARHHKTSLGNVRERSFNRSGGGWWHVPRFDDVNICRCCCAVVLNCTGSLLRRWATLRRVVLRLHEWSTCLIEVYWSHIGTLTYVFYGIVWT